MVPSHTAIIHGQRRYTYAQFLARSSQLANALAGRGIGPGDCVAIMGANTPEMLEAHNGVPMLGAVLNSLNIRLDANTIAFILDHGEAKVLLTDRAFSEVIKEALTLTERELLVIDIDDSESRGRVAGAVAAVYLWDDWQPQGLRLPPPRRLPECAGQHGDHGT